MNKEEILKKVKKKGLALKDASDDLRADKEILYFLKDFLMENEYSFSVEYEMLKSYEREDELHSKLVEKNNSPKIKQKI